MTAVGKFLVFLNFVFGVVICALIVLVYVTRTNWRTEFENAKRGAEAARAAFQAEAERHLADVASKDKEIAKLRGDLTEGQKQLTDVQGKLAALEAEYKKMAAAQGSEATNSNLAQAELDRIRQERDRLRQEKQDRETQIVKLTEELSTQRKQTTANRIAYESAQQRNEKLLERVEEMARENRELKYRVSAVAAGGPVTGADQSVLAAPPPQLPRDIRGKVTHVTEDGDLVQISIGTDSGVRPGATLSVYRLEPTPAYLGELLISRADPKAAVGRFTAMNRHMPRPGDTVGNDLNVSFPR